VAFFNKQRLHRCCRCVLWFSSSLTRHGGEEDGGKLQATYGGGGCWGNFDTEHIHAVGIFAAAILCRKSGRSSTSNAEAWNRSGHGSSKSPHHEVIRSPWCVGGPWLRCVAGRGLPSYWSLLLGGHASRTPARGGWGVLGPNCISSFCSRVLFVKSLALSADRRFPRALDEKGCNLIMYLPRLMK
jgi:hypothetical protein